MRTPVVAAALLLTTASALAEDPQILRFDPFNALPAEATPRAGSSRERTPWRATLLATLVSGADSSVNLGGEVLRIGESINGYQLLEVRPFEAVFRRAEERVVLSVVPGSAASPGGAGGSR